jgi:glutathione peroxidase
MKLTVLAALMTLGVAVAGTAGTTVGAPGGEAMTRSIHQFTVRTIDGKDVSLGEYRGKVLLVVNTASKCGFTPQYEGLEALYEKYRGRGFEVLAFPANNFMGQEPGTDGEIAQFCELNYKTTFPLFSKISVKGTDMAPLYAWLTKQPGFEGDIGWNFTKFLVGPDGHLLARYGSRTEPRNEKLVAQIEAALPATQK